MASLEKGCAEPSHNPQVIHKIILHLGDLFEVDNMADKNQRPLKTPTPTPFYNSQTGGSHVDIEPLDPRQGQVIDLTKPHAYDEVLPPPDKPGLNLPGIQELNKAGTSWKAKPIPSPTPEEYKRNETKKA